MVPAKARRFGRHSSPTLLGAGLSVVLIVALFAPGTSAASSAMGVPASGALFGAYVRTAGGGGTSFINGVSAFENKLGRKLALVNKYHDWSMTNFSDEAKLIASGHVVMTSWHPTDNRAGDPARASKVVSGQYDALIRSAADNMKPLGSNILLRWDFEMTQLPGQPEYVGPPAEFIAAWRHIHDIFVSRGATNVQWVWAPQSAGFSHGTAAAFYPGDAYVDWIEASDVMGGKYWSSFDKLFTPMYQWSAPRGKRLMVWMGVPENPSDPNWKANWFNGMRATIKSSMPKIKAVVYYHANDWAGNFIADTTPRSWAAFRSLGMDPYFNSGSGGYRPPPPPPPSKKPNRKPAPKPQAQAGKQAGPGNGLVTGENSGTHCGTSCAASAPVHGKAASAVTRARAALARWSKNGYLVIVAAVLLIGFVLLLLTALLLPMRAQLKARRVASKEAARRTVAGRAG